MEEKQENKIDKIKWLFWVTLLGGAIAFVGYFVGTLG